MEVRAKGIKKDFIRRSANTNVFTAVEETDITLFAGELAIVCGRSGGGKSTLLNMLSGILQPTGGSVLYDDKDIFAMPDKELSLFRNRHIGYIPQGASAISSLRVRENILLPFVLSDEAEDEAEERAELLMERFDIAHLADAKTNELSGGELRRMAIARALIRRPDVIFADEPTGDLDDENTRIVFGVLKEEAERGAAVLCVTHENDAADYADQWYRMDVGHIV